ncbi:MAG UNVERIFIED_CONTAM: hypothetical protein LVR18_18030 [Planctomycetaceae bacterium]|jgi:hypothetical protein
MNLKIAAFVFGAALSWGVYVPIVHEATSRLGSNLRAFILVGVAYFLVAVLVPTLLLLLLKSDPTAKVPEKLNWNSASVIWGLLAGTSGALAPCASSSPLATQLPPWGPPSDRCSSLHWSSRVLQLSTQSHPSQSLLTARNLNCRARFSFSDW